MNVGSSNPASWTTSSSAPPPKESSPFKWVAIGCGAVVLLVVAAIVGGVVLLFGSFRSSQPVRMAVARAERNPEVQRALGTPLRVGWFISGNFNVSGSSGKADAQVPVTGPRGRGTIYLAAHKTAGEWSFDRLEIELPGHAERVNLMEPAMFQARNSRMASQPTYAKLPFTANPLRFSRLR